MTTESEPQLSLQAMMSEGPEWLDSYLRQVAEGKITPHAMLGIQAGATSRAHTEDSLQWAAIAVRAAHLHALQDGGEHRASALLKAMLLRAWFISRMGSKPGHPILDRDIILDWFKAETELSLTAVKEKSARCKNTTVGNLTPSELLDFRNELIKLRNIKGRIGVLRMLADSHELPDTPALNEWLEVSNEIP